VVGMLLGLGIAFTKNSLVLGPSVASHFPAADAGYCALGSIVAGIVLSMLASIYPSWSAARMAPMEAMRVE